MASVAYDIYRHPALMCTIECTSDVYVCKHLGCFFGLFCFVFFLMFRRQLLCLNVSEYALCENIEVSDPPGPPGWLEDCYNKLNAAV